MPRLLGFRIVPQRGQNQPQLWVGAKGLSESSNVFIVNALYRCRRIDNGDLSLLSAGLKCLKRNKTAPTMPGLFSGPI